VWRQVLVFDANVALSGSEGETLAVVRGLIALGTVVAGLTFAAPAYASAPTTGAGSGVITSVSITSTREADGNIIQVRELTGTVTGTLNGTFAEQVRGVIHPSGLVTFHGVMTFDGAVAGCGSGTVTIGLSGLGVTGAPVTVAAIRVIDQASSTLGVKGVGTVTQDGPLLSYEVRYHC
jgi:hypothetical protein